MDACAWHRHTHIVLIMHAYASLSFILAVNARAFAVPTRYLLASRARARPALTLAIAADLGSFWQDLDRH